MWQQLLLPSCGQLNFFYPVQIFWVLLVNSRQTIYIFKAFDKNSIFL